MIKDAKERFMEKVRKSETGCWEWNGYIAKSGYGDFHYDKKTINSHRMAWILFHGKIPKGSDYHGVCLLHKCDNRRCVNPEHLFLGTNKDNIYDSVKKGRRKGITRKRPSGLNYRSMSMEGKENHRKVKEPDRMVIRKLYKDGNFTQKQLADKYGVHFQTIQRCVGESI